MMGVVGIDFACLDSSTSCIMMGVVVVMADMLDIANMSGALSFSLRNLNIVVIWSLFQVNSSEMRIGNGFDGKTCTTMCI